LKADLSGQRHLQVVRAERGLERLLALGIGASLRLAIETHFGVGRGLDLE
jgi:hypothetical protein